MLTQLVFASQNQGKVAEVRAALQPLGILTTSVADYPQTAKLDVAETATDFQGNAELKATAYAKALNLPVLADDSGLEVISLDNEPGVSSNRWFKGSDADRNQALLARLLDKTDRRARFVTVLCFFDPITNVKKFFRGEVDGVIITEPAGEAGFGYDPIFVPEGQTKTFAELGIEIKNQLSHRGRALQLFKQQLEQKKVL